jgi:hypothetical protein
MSPLTHQVVQDDLLGDQVVRLPCLRLRQPPVAFQLRGPGDALGPAAEQLIPRLAAVLSAVMLQQHVPGVAVTVVPLRLVEGHPVQGAGIRHLVSPHARVFPRAVTGGQLPHAPRPSRVFTLAGSCQHEVTPGRQQLL